jgi:ribonuclease P protein component
MVKRYGFSRSNRLGGRGTFKSIRDRGIRETRGPLTLWAVRSETETQRLGISIGRPVGNAARRNRIKRQLRESFRLSQHDLPRGYDWLIAVRPHAPLELAEYRDLLVAMITKAHSRWQQRACAGS